MLDTALTKEKCNNLYQFESLKSYNALKNFKQVNKIEIKSLHPDLKTRV